MSYSGIPTPIAANVQFEFGVDFTLSSNIDHVWCLHVALLCIGHTKCSRIFLFDTSDTNTCGLTGANLHSRICERVWSDL